MQSITLTCCFFAFILANLCLHLASAMEEVYQSCNSNYYTVNSTYGSNLAKLFSSFSTESVAIQGFSENTTGESPDQVSGLVLCRGDVNSTVCGRCINQSIVDVMKLCPYSEEATIYYTFCILRYSNQNFLNSTNNIMDQMILYNSANFSGWDPMNETVQNYYNSVLNTLLTSVADQAAYTSIKRFATGVINITSSVPVIYALAQCTPDLSNNTCRACLQDLIDQVLKYYDGRQGGRILGVRCRLRYELYIFFSGTVIHINSISETIPPSLLPTNSPSSGNKEVESAQEEIIFTTSDETLDPWSRERTSDVPLFKFYEIANATGNFSLHNKLGEGGFGPVYKGVLHDGLEVAVKRLSTYSGQGQIEFRNEIQLIAKLQHRNLVRLLGWCIQGDEKILIYEFMPNKSLDYFIFDSTQGALLNWERRFQIIEGIAQGLLYLHKHSRLRIVHRDLKASNILLDLEMNPKISDFGLARIFSQKELQANTNRVVGTYGYMAPEYASEGLFSVKSDVFSFGVLLLEIVSGKKNVGSYQYGDFRNLLGYAWDRWKGANVPDLICHTLTGISLIEIERCIHVGLLCVQENPGDRPIMSDVIAFLTSAAITLPEPKHPAYFNVRVEEVVKSPDFEGSSQSMNGLTLTNPVAR